MPSARRFLDLAELRVSGNVICQHLPWDSGFFGYRIARAIGERMTERELQSVCEWCHEQRIDCLYFLADPADAAGLRRLEKQGFRQVDTRVTLRRSSATPPIPLQFPRGRVRPVSDSDLGGLREIAKTSHRNTRFWNDGHFPPSLCDALYERWIENSFRGQADRVFVAEWEGQPVGYITCHREISKEGRIGLFAVDERARGNGIGAGLLRDAIQWFQSEAITDILVVTQGNNEPAQRAYRKQAFLIESVRSWFHYWPRLAESRPPR
jgi:dTDP-4-amino-4,6-dideoxy-D-galactose acyltransferase